LRIVERAWPRHDWEAKLNETAIAAIQANADFLYEEQQVDRRVDVARELAHPQA
jgi:hypothetical protein